jgi:hypothetical protein
MESDKIFKINATLHNLAKVLLFTKFVYFSIPVTNDPFIRLP